jgi:twitching motility protein PilU
MFFAVNSPVHIKINGNLIPINQQKLEPENIHALLAEIATPEQMEELAATNELEHGRVGAQPGPLPPVRVQAARHHLRRIPLCAGHHSAAGRPAAAASAGGPDHGKARLLLLVGSTGSGKSTTIAAMLDHRNELRSGHILTLEDPIEYLFRNKNPSSTSARSAATPRTSTPRCATPCARRRTAS